MSQDRDDFGDLDQVSPSLHEEHEESGYPQEIEDDGEAEPPKRRRSSNNKSSGGSLMRTVVPIVAIVGVLGGGWFGWSYYSSTHMTPPPQQHKNAFPVRKTGPDAPVAQNIPNNGNNANTLNLAPAPQNQVASLPPQHQNIAQPPPPGNTLPMTDEPQPLHAPATDDVPPGFPSSSPLKVPAQPLIAPPGTPGAQAQALAPAPQKVATPELADMFDSKMASFLSDVKEGHESIKDTIKDTSEKAVNQIEAKVDQMGNQVSVQIGELTKKTEELSKQVDAMSHPVVEEKGKVAGASTTGNLHKPRTIVHRNKPVKVKKTVAQDTVRNNGSWHLRGVSRELIVLQDPKGNYMPVKIGSNVSGLGTIEGVEQTQGGKYIVKTSTSTIQE